MLRSALFLLTIFSWLACIRLPMSAFQTGNLIHLDSTRIETNSKVEKIIAPYSNQIDSLVSVVVGYNAHPMFVKKPESDLGDLMADYMLKFASTQYGYAIDLALFNSGGFRIPLPAGKITVGHVMQLMPFDNTLVVMTLTGEEMQRLAEQIVRKGGDPIAGRESVQLIKVDEKVTLMLDGRAIIPEQKYKVLTSSYLAEGGDGYSVLLEGDDIINTGMLIRDAIQKMYQTETSINKPASKIIEGRILLNP